MVRSQSVSPVKVFFKPTRARYRPRRSRSISSRWLACICSSRPIAPAGPWSSCRHRSQPKRARIDAEIRQSADERVGDDLEGQRERTARRRWTMKLQCFVGLGIGRDQRGEVQRRRQIIDDRVEHRLHALVLQGGAAEHGDQLALAMVALRSAARSSSAVISSPSRYFSVSSSSVSATRSISLSRCLARLFQPGPRG